MNADKPTPREKAKAEREKIDRLALAFRQVFGTDAARTHAQKLVWTALRQWGYADRSTMVQHTPGHVDPMLMAAGEGHRQFFLQIEDFIRRASEVGEAPVKPDVIKS